jgi:phage N-6-adenine-methyltransferase
MRNNMINKGLFTSKTDEWETPQDLFGELNCEFEFMLDVCADKYNHKCKEYFTKEDDGLSKNWTNWGYKWMNPPYGREIGKWVEKAAYSGKTVCLLPARTDTEWFWNYIYKQRGVEIRFIKGRLKFGGSKNSAPFPSMIVIFK